MAKGVNTFCPSIPVLPEAGLAALPSGFWSAVGRGSHRQIRVRGEELGVTIAWLSESPWICRVPLSKATASVNVPSMQPLPGSCCRHSPLVFGGLGTTGAPHCHQPPGSTALVPQTLPTSSLNIPLVTFSSISQFEWATCFLPGPDQDASLLSVFMSFVCKLFHKKRFIPSTRHD